MTENLHITRIHSAEDLRRAHPVMQELRQGLSLEDFLSLYERAHATSGYEILAVEKDQKIVALMGYRFLYDYVHGKHLYIDDLVSTASQRSHGIGAQLLSHAEKLAQEAGCKNLRLCTGIENEQGKKFYEKNNWNLRAIVYKKKISGNPK